MIKAVYINQDVQGGLVQPLFQKDREWIVVTYISCFSVDVLSTGPWSTLKELEDMDLRRLAEALPSSVHCRATSTTKKYLEAFKRWKVWAADHKLPVFPVEEVHVALYLQLLAETKYSKSAVEETVNGLAWAYAMVGISSPTVSPIVQTTLEGLKWMLVKSVNKSIHLLWKCSKL